MEDYLKECVVDIPKRSFTLISDKAEALELVCEEAEQFQRVLELLDQRAMLKKYRTSINYVTFGNVL